LESAIAEGTVCPYDVSFKLTRVLFTCQVRPASSVPSNTNADLGDGTEYGEELGYRQEPVLVIGKFR
jgi:hypothetical protein